MEKLAPPALVSKELPAGIVDVLFVLLDVDGDGCLDQEEFMALMKRQSAIPDPVRLGLSFRRHMKWHQPCYTPQRQPMFKMKHSSVHINPVIVFTNINICFLHIIIPLFCLSVFG